MQDLPKGLHYLPDGTLGDLLLIIDMQNVYLEGQPWGCAHTSQVMDRIRQLVDQQRVDNVILTKFLPPQNPVGTWKKYNEDNREINENPWMSELISSCLPLAQQYPVFIKDKYSSFENEQVKELAGKARRVLISGVVAECCVLFTLLAGIDAGNEMIYLKDACTGLDDEWESIVEKVAHYYEPMHVRVMNINELRRQDCCDIKERDV